MELSEDKALRLMTADHQVMVSISPDGKAEFDWGLIQKSGEPLAKMLLAAHENGYDEGWDQGYTSGYDKGDASGREAEQENAFYERSERD